MKNRYWTKLHETVDGDLAAGIRASIGPDMAQLSGHGTPLHDRGRRSSDMVQ